MSYRCGYQGVWCEYANEFGGCSIGQQNCDQYDYYIMEDDIGSYLYFDFFA